MQIQIRLPAEVDPSQHPLPPPLAKIGANETVIIELQGSIEIQGEKFGQLIGNLDVTNVEKPTLKIAHHLLEGKLVKLQRPLAVLLRNDGGPVSFDMVAIVKQKLVFSQRPVPIVGASAVALSASSGDGNDLGAKRRKIG